MLVLVTGGTGYVGSHAIAALTNAGHGVRLLARSPDRIPAALEPLGVEAVETAIGDVTESAAVERALEGCDAVVHAASVFSTDARNADEMKAVNVRGTDIATSAGSPSGPGSATSTRTSCATRWPPRLSTAACDSKRSPPSSGIARWG